MNAAVVLLTAGRCRSNFSFQTKFECVNMLIRPVLLFENETVK